MRFRRVGAVLFSAIMATTGLVANQGTASAIAGCPIPDGDSHCHAVGGYGPSFNFPPTYVNALGANIAVDCLHVGNRATDFINFEMWLTTDAGNWVEEGMTAGTLWASPGQEQGFIWYWADMRRQLNSYSEHYIGNASTGTYSNVAFYGEGGGNWGVYRNGTKIGTSLGMGQVASGGQLGAESTSRDVTVNGNANSWGFYGYDNNWHLVSGEAFYNNSQGLMTGYANGQYVHAQTPSCSGLTSTGTFQAPTADPAGLAATARKAALATGEDNPYDVRVVRSNRKAANAMVGSDTAGDQAVHVIQQRGSFTSPGGRAPVGHQAPTGNVLTTTIDAVTGQLLDLTITSEAPDLNTLGTVTTLG